MGTDQVGQQLGTQIAGAPATATPENKHTHWYGVAFEHVPHPHIARRKLQGPIKVADQLPRHNVFARINTRIALIITIAVGSMWCAYLFTLLALVSLPSALATHDKIIIVSWIAQTFLQLVLLPVIIVGQNIQGAAADRRSEQTYNDAEAVLHEAVQIQQHLSSQDSHLAAQDERLNQIIAALVKAYPDAAAELQQPKQQT